MAAAAIIVVSVVVVVYGYLASSSICTIISTISTVVCQGCGGHRHQHGVPQEVQPPRGYGGRIDEGCGSSDTDCEDSADTPPGQPYLRSQGNIHSCTWLLMIGGGGGSGPYLV